MSDAKLQELYDRLEIIDLLYQYGRGGDLGEWEGLRSVFTEEVEYDFSSLEGAPPVKMRSDEWVAQARSLLTGMKATQHIITNHVINIKGDEATCIAYIHSQHYLPNETKEDTFLVGGYYTGHLVRTSQGWKIDKWKLNVTWTEGNRNLFTFARDRVALATAR